MDAHDIAVDLVTKLDAASLKAEEGSVTALLLGCLAGNRKLESCSSRDFCRDGDDLCLNIIARGLDQLGASGPGSLAVVAHPPRLAEDIIADDLMLVGEALLDKAG